MEKKNQLLNNMSQYPHLARYGKYNELLSEFLRFIKCCTIRWHKVGCETLLGCEKSRLWESLECGVELH